MKEITNNTYLLQNNNDHMKRRGKVFRLKFRFRFRFRFRFEVFKHLLVGTTGIDRFRVFELVVRI